ncbi:MAG TPA: hypothetical protein VNW52_09015 [Burkholderiaceae bacterium]|jgi:hypothetical protein|nr:hypothetical protein [Burkholderiaceae bacterium]
MCAKKEVAIVCIGLGLATQVRAQLAEFIGPPHQVTQGTAPRAAPHYDYYGNGLIHSREKWQKPEAELSSGLAPEHGKAFSPNNAAPTGLHWEAGARRPALEYKLSDQATIHFHVGRRGSSAAAVWSF